jgi:hypothetical protein
MATSSEPATQSPRNAADRLVVKLRTAWQDLRSCTHRAVHAAAIVQQAPADLQNLQEMRAWFEGTSQQLLMDPLERFFKLQPVKSALDALSMRDPEISTRALNARSRIDRKFQRILIATALDLPELWRIFRAGNNVVESQSWQKRREAHNKEASAVLDRYARWAQKAIGEEKKREEAPRDPRNDLWWRQHRALLETLQVEMAWRNLTLTWFSASETLIGDVHRESEEARSYKTATLQWLEEGARSDLAHDSSFALITPEERLRGWALPIESEARLNLAERTELLVGGFRPRLKRIAMHSRFLRAFDTYARKRMRGLIEHSWQMTARVVRDAEQSKEIIAYWGETSLNRPGEASQLIEEARQNAMIALVEEPTLVPVEELNREAVEAFWRWHQAGSFMLEANQDGWFAFLRRPRARSFLPTAAEMLRLQSRTALLGSAHWMRGRVERTMESSRFAPGDSTDNPSGYLGASRGKARVASALSAALSVGSGGGPPLSSGSRSGVGRYRSGCNRLGGRKICSMSADWGAR